MAADIVIVPDLSAVDLTALVKCELNLTYFNIDCDYVSWDYYTDLKNQTIRGRGQKYEVLVWEPKVKPDETISSEAVQKHFRDLGAFGHTGAFTQWRRICGLQGYHASIPGDCACWCLAHGNLGTPCSVFVGGQRQLNRRWRTYVWSHVWSFVAFREIPC